MFSKSTKTATSDGALATGAAPPGGGGGPTDPPPRPPRVYGLPLADGPYRPGPMRPQAVSHRPEDGHSLARGRRPPAPRRRPPPRRSTRAGQRRGTEVSADSGPIGNRPRGAPPPTIEPATSN